MKKGEKIKQERELCMCVYNVDIVARKGFIKKRMNDLKEVREAATCEKCDPVKEIACAKHRTGMCLVCFRNHKEASVAGME